ncbi:MAG: T9SS type A sorting domain-containing protein [Ferruginibacter sp.]
MKPGNSTQLFGFFLKSANALRTPNYFTRLLLALFLLASFASYAGENNKFSGTPGEHIRANLYLLNSNNTTILADGVLTEYNDLYHDSVTLEDAYKFTNIKENLGITRYGKILAVERRPIIAASDTLFLKLWKTSCRNYQLEIVTANLNHPGMQAFLEDAFLNTSAPITLTGTTKFNFAVTTDMASGNIDRFRIVYKTAAFNASTLPVTFSSIKGSLQSNKIVVEWKVENEINIEKYEVERSDNGINFSSVSEASVNKQNGAVRGYSWVDNSPVTGNNFYRVKSVDLDGSKKYSLVVKVTRVKANAGSITIYPNPIKGNMVNLQFTNQSTGIYQVRLINNNGQVVYTGRLPVNSNNISQTIFTRKKLSGGIYQLEIKAPDNTINVQQAIVQE